MKFYSPLRYPGGKRRLAKFIAGVCERNNIDGHYVEPYAGGAAVALHLLIEGHVKEITLNDLDRSIYSFWWSVLNRTDEFCDLIINSEVSLENRDRQKKIQENKERESLLALGFSTFFLNRTNKSGIINGGPIGGLNQKGKYKVDCRFNREDLVQRVRTIASHKNHINLENLDALDLIEKVEKKSRDSDTIFYFDPPYYLKGSSLYMNHYVDKDHIELSEKIKKIKNAKWLVSYDDVPEIGKLYRGYKTKRYKLAHTVQTHRHVGSEIIFSHEDLKLPRTVI